MDAVDRSQHDPMRVILSEPGEMPIEVQIGVRGEIKTTLPLEPYEDGLATERCRPVIVHHVLELMRDEEEWKDRLANPQPEDFEPLRDALRERTGVNDAVVSLYLSTVVPLG